MGGTIRVLIVIAALLAPFLLGGCFSDDGCSSSCNPCEKRSCEPPVRNQGKNGEPWTH